MNHVIAFDFQGRRMDIIRLAEAAGRIREGCFVWFDVDLAEAAAEAELAEVGLPPEQIASLLRGEPEVSAEIDANRIRFEVKEGRCDETGFHSTSVQALMTGQALFTVHQGPVEFLRHMASHCREDFIKFSRSPGFLLYEMGEGLLEMHRRLRRRFATEAESLHDHLLDEADELLFSRISRMTRDLLKGRKIVQDAGDTWERLATRKSAALPETTQPFLRSIAEAIHRIAEDLTVHRDTLNDAVNLYLSAVSHRTNRVVKRLTILGTIFMPLTFLCGVYGMNMTIPEAGWAGMYYLFWGICAGLAGALFWIMRRWKWF
ncbi:MAG: CorA family divalent cation transporter [Kiritimatiellia bacterium]|nr:CorA family divalent cation transporter [Kiritimatiellia bacterium]